MVSVVAGVVVIEDGKVLLVQEAFEKVRGKWNLPAGRVDKGETFEQAAIREAKEETGFDIKIIKPLITIHQSPQDSVLHAFLAKRTGGTLAFDSDEMLDVAWVSVEEALTKLDLRNEEYIRGAINAALKAGA
jgi:ADP-ribose pyrophosphatase YjhB (NUDIX family)